MLGSPAVSVEIATEPGSDLADAAIASCDGALGAGGCQLATTGAPPAGQYYALVSFGEGGLDVLRVEFREHARDGELLDARELRFEERDTPQERWASVGVVIAALVASHRHSVPHMIEPAPPPPPREPKSERWLRFDLGLVMTGALDESPPQLGGAFRASFLVAPSPIFVTSSIGQQFRLEGQPDVRWLTGALGVGARFGSLHPRLSEELRSEAVIERVSISATQSGRSEAQSRTRFGARLGLDGVWAASSHSSLILGGQVTVLRPAVSIDIDARAVERASAWGWGVIWAFRYAP